MLGKGYSGLWSVDGVFLLVLEMGAQCFGVGFVHLHAPTLGLTPRSTPLVPIFSFGENDLFEQVRNPKGSWLRKLQHRLQQIMGISLPLFHARGIFQYSFGLVPYRRPICTVGKSFLGTMLATLSLAKLRTGDSPWVVSSSCQAGASCQRTQAVMGWKCAGKGASPTAHLSYWFGTLAWSSDRAQVIWAVLGKQTRPPHHLYGMQPTPISVQPSNTNRCGSVGLNFFQANFTNTSRTTPKQFAGLLSVPCRHSRKPQSICR